MTGQCLPSFLYTVIGADLIPLLCLKCVKSMVRLVAVAKSPE